MAHCVWTASSALTTISHLIIKISPDPYACSHEIYLCQDFFKVTNALRKTFCYPKPPLPSPRPVDLSLGPQKFLYPCILAYGCYHVCGCLALLPFLNIYGLLIKLLKSFSAMRCRNLDKESGEWNWVIFLDTETDTQGHGACGRRCTQSAAEANFFIHVKIQQVDETGKWEHSKEWWDVKDIYQSVSSLSICGKS